MSRDDRIFRNVVIAYALMEAVVIAIFIVMKLRH
jgi:hypothetical protein